MKIHLDLSHHCIATETKKRYNKCLSDYFKHKGDNAHLEAEIDILKDALERLDFPGLRARYPELSGHNHAQVFLHRVPESGLSLTLGDKPLDLLFITPNDALT
ncbi:MAG: hypothetical protein KKD44_00100 [Proteobacteria bacterium]|nr:hypothetical protein [Pseudomonadota bacterium]